VHRLWHKDSTKPKLAQAEGMSDPTTDHDWTIRALNIHGTFFERWCREIIQRSAAWRVRYSNYPVGWMRSHEGALDIRADQLTEGHLISLLIECKKHNPEFVDWVFFPQLPATAEQAVLRLSQLRWQSVDQVTWNVVVKHATLPWRSLVTDEARETRGDYLGYKKQSDKTKTANRAIEEAAHQVAVATQWIRFEEQRFGNALGATVPAQPPPHTHHHIIPVIVTTAKLYLCEFDPADIDPATGGLPLDKAHLTSVPNLRYEYPIPLSIQAGPPAEELSQILLDRQMHRFQRLQIEVINSRAFEGFLRDFDFDPNHPYHRI
jgi:hypothetical protein